MIGTAAVAAPDLFGADTAAVILAAGGNAVDAAVATAFTLAVTYPEAGNLGGGGFATLQMDGEAHFLDFRGSAPLTASADMYLDRVRNVIPDASTTGVGAATVPGTVAGLWELHRRFGKLPWRTNVGPAIRHARQGFGVHAMLQRERDQRAAKLKGRTNFLAHFGALRTGDTFRQPELAATLERIAKDGPRDFYQGETAELLVAEMRRNNGHISLGDLARYRAAWRQPLRGKWADHEVITAPLPSAGGIALLSLLAMKSCLSEHFVGVALNSAQYVHLLAEMEKRVFADRIAYLGDPDFIRAPVERLLEAGYLARRAKEVSVDRISRTESMHPGFGEHHATTHFGVLDARGNAVSLTYTLNDYFGCGQVVTGAGFLMNNEMDDFSIKPGVPNEGGVVGGAANAIAPRKQPLSTMSPTLLTRDGRLSVIIGTPGGSRIATSLVQVLSNWYDFKLPLDRAVAEPRIHHQLLPPDTLFEEPYAALEPRVRAELITRGYRFVQQAWNGDVQVIALGGSGVSAVSDPRGRGVARIL